jgi:hypothetical protein
MDRKKTKDKGKKNAVAGFMNASACEEMSRMMGACCTGQDASSNCCAMMKEKMKAMRDGHCCTPGNETVDSRKNA